MKIKLLKHFITQSNLRGIDINISKKILIKPDQIVDDIDGNKIAQKKYFDKELKKECMIRIVFRKEQDTLIGITVYKTSKINKYWRK